MFVLAHLCVCARVFVFVWLCSRVVLARLCVCARVVVIARLCLCICARARVRVLLVSGLQGDQCVRTPSAIYTSIRR